MAFGLSDQDFSKFRSDKQLKLEIPDKAKLFGYKTGEGRLEDRMLDILAKGGPVLWVLILLGIPMIAVVIERFLYFRKIRTDENKFFQRIKGALEKGHFEEALAICDTSESPLAALVRTGIDCRRLSETELKDAVKEAAGREIPRLEKNIAVLGVIANISPLLGLLGTVSGIINAFGVLGRFGSVTDPSVLAKGISEALFTTAAGIIIAVPALIFHSWVSHRADSTIMRLEGQTGDLVRLISQAPKDPKESRRAPL